MTSRELPYQCNNHLVYCSLWGFWVHFWGLWFWSWMGLVVMLITMIGFILISRRDVLLNTSNIDWLSRGAYQTGM